MRGDRRRVRRSVRIEIMRAEHGEEAENVNI
jgi:hypothetical protein